MNRLVSIFISGLLLACTLGAGTLSAAEFQLRDGDRVVLLGDGLIEQEQYHGWLELALTTAFADRDVTFRNLGWSADTPAGDSRFGLSLVQAGKEPEGEGWRQLGLQLEQAKPTVVILGYGMASSLELGPDGMDAFGKQYKRLIQKLRSITPDVRLVFLSPLQRLDDPAQAPTNQDHGATLRQYSRLIKEIALGEDGLFVDLRDTASQASQRKDAIHLNDAGYQELAATVLGQLHLNAPEIRDNAGADQLREAILRKNQLFFHRSRPANMAYVFGFRKHEQGQNAVEIPQFDPLIAAEEKVIASLRGLNGVLSDAPEKRTQSKYAEFTPQPTPQFTVGEGLEVTLWAENPQLNKPIQINFDPSGRLWVASSEAYPMIEVGQTANDKVIVLEDTDCDGKSDQSTVFADGLLIPTGVLPAQGGVYVAQSTDLLFLEDTNGDGKADKKTRVLSGFGTEDTHHNLHTLRWGPDGRLYMNQSVYTRTDAETPRGVTRLKAGGGFRFDPRSRRMQVLFRGLWNAWGHQFDAYGRSFMTDGAGFQGVAYVFPGAAFHPVPDGRPTLGLISPGNYPKFCSAEIVQGDAFPRDWQGSLITCDFRANRVTRFKLVEKDAGFATEQQADLLRTSASSFRPIDVKQGPDGALYIADWSNPIINHGEVDFRDPRRDRWHGRIWRVAFKDAKSKQPVDLAKQSTADLLDQLTSNDRHHRDQARRVLVWRADETASLLRPWVSVQGRAEDRLQGLWLSQAINRPDPELLDQLLVDADANVRAAAVRVLADWSDPDSDMAGRMTTDQATKRFAKAVVDEHPLVRLEAICGLSRQRSFAAARLALDALEKPVDRFIQFALAKLVRSQSESLIQAIETGQWIASENDPLATRRLEFVLTSVPPAQASRYLEQFLDRSAIPADGSGPWISLIGKAGGPDELARLVRQASSGGLSADATVRALSALSDAQRLRKTRPAQGRALVAKLFDHSGDTVRVAAIRLAGVWKLAGQMKSISRLVEDEGQPDAVRLAAIGALGMIGGEAAKQQMLKSLDQLADSDRQQLVAKALGELSKLDAKAAVEPFLRLQTEIQEESQATLLWRSMLAGRNADKHLAGALGSAAMTKSFATTGLRVAREGGRDAPELVAALLPLSGQTITADQMTPEQMRELATKALKEGDPHAGEVVYQREALACVSCHAIGGFGGRVGPDMTSLGASAPIDYLVESLFDPNAKIKEGYHSVIVVTEDDRVLTGIEVENGDDELVLRDAQNKLVRISQAEVIGKKAGKSLMPAGLLDRVSMQDQVNLVSFLSRLGKPGPFDASRGGVAREVAVLAGTHRVEQGGGAEKIVSGKYDVGWKPLMTLVDGSIKGQTLRQLTVQPINISLIHVYLRTEVEVDSSRTVRFVVEGPDQAAAFWDGTQLNGTNEFALEAQPGKHTVLIRLDARDLPDVARIRSTDVTFLPSS
ncbi:MAG: PVC-type heme-binding CxxCH protein [Planctomycetota bacterium]